MVRLSDFMTPATPAAPPPPAATVPLTPSVARSIVRPRGAAVQPPAAADSQSLYTRLVRACEGCLALIQQEQPPALGEIPALVEQMVDRLIARDAHLLRLGMTGGQPFSLAAHGVNVAVLAVSVGAELGLKRPVLADLGIAALLHDLGMTKVAHLLPLAHHLDPGQVEEMREHPVWGERIARRFGELPPMAREVVAQEHERQDGSGYPRRLVGSDIHEQAQLVGLLDVYEALTHDRPYRRRVMPAEAARVITQHHRAAFRRDLLQAFLRAVPVFPVESWVRLSNGDLAQVTAASVRHPLSPTVSIRFDRMRQPYPSPETVDLSRDTRLAIVEAIPEPKAGS